jgi:hypothetical protein
MDDATMGAIAAAISAALDRYAPGARWSCVLQTSEGALTTANVDIEGQRRLFLRALMAVDHAERRGTYAVITAAPRPRGKPS